MLAIACITAEHRYFSRIRQVAPIYIDVIHGSFVHYLGSTTVTTVQRPFPRTIWESRHQKGRTIPDLMNQEMAVDQLDHMQMSCTSLQTDNHAST